MSEHNPNPIVVAVGHDPIDGALAFAAGEAVRSECGLHLVHVVHLLAQGPGMSLVAETNLEHAGRLALNAAVERARDVVEGVPVTTDLRVGGVVPTLVEVAETSRMIVLQRRDLSSLMRIVTRSVSSGVAAHAHVPVVSVPSRWQPRRTPGDLPTVTVGVDVAERSAQVLRAAAAEARSRGAVLRVLHAWKSPSAYDDIVLTRAESKQWTARATAEVQAVIHALGDEVAGVPIRIEAPCTYAADALIGASRETTLLVIGRHDPLVPVGSHLGPIARAVLREAECPVLLVDPRPTRRSGRRTRKGAVAEAV